MRENDVILDANAILRFLLQDNDEQFHQVRLIIQRKNCLPKLDFVDCLLYGYKREKGINIVTFDQKLLKRLDTIFL